MTSRGTQLVWCIGAMLSMSFLLPVHTAWAQFDGPALEQPDVFQAPNLGEIDGGSMTAPDIWFPNVGPERPLESYGLDGRMLGERDDFQPLMDQLYEIKKIRDDQLKPIYDDVNSIGAVPDELRMQLRNDIQQVAPGTDVPGRFQTPAVGMRPDTGADLTNLAPGKFVADADCYIPDPTMLPRRRDDGSTNFCYDSEGFRYVGLLVRGTGSDTSLPFEYYKPCTASLIGSRWALTALHCVTDAAGLLTEAGRWQRTVGSLLPWGRLENAPKRLRLLVPKPNNGAERELYGCLTWGGMFAGGPCGFEVIEVRSIIFPETQWRMTSKLPDIDLAILELNSDGVNTDMESLAELPSSINAKLKFVTFSGYGLSDFTEYVEDRSLLVAYNSISIEGDFLTWTITRDGPAGGPCSADSGSGVFRDYIIGRADERREIVGVVSWLLPLAVRSGEIVGDSGIRPGITAKDCRSSKGFAVNLVRFVPAICALTNDEAKGC